MFPDIKNETTPVGLRNVESARNKLQELNIPIVVEDVGGNRGRTIILDTKTGILIVKTLFGGEKEI